MRWLKLEKVKEMFEKGKGFTLDNVHYKLNRITTQSYTSTTNGEDVYTSEHEYFGVSNDGIIKINNLNKERIKWDA